MCGQADWKHAGGMGGKTCGRQWQSQPSQNEGAGPKAGRRQRPSEGLQVEEDATVCGRGAGGSSSYFGRGRGSTGWLIRQGTHRAAAAMVKRGLRVVPHSAFRQRQGDMQGTRLKGVH